MKRRRVKITGIGPVTPAGIGRESFWKGILEPVSRVRPYEKLGEELGPFVAAYLSNFEIGKFFEDKRDIPRGVARHTLFAVAAALLALRDAQLGKSELQRLSCAVVIGSSLLDFGGIGASIEAVQRRGFRAAHARAIFTTSSTGIVEVVSQVCGIIGRTRAVQTSCCSGLDAIGQAAELVAAGEVDLALCGGTECPLHQFPLLELRAAGLTPPTAEMPERMARPFDLWRTTGVVSEGAAVLVLEPESSPRAGYSFISGYGFASDPPDAVCGGLVQSARLALAASRLRPESIDCINAWGPGHKLVDAGEADAMVAVFGKGLERIPVFSIKGAIGSPLGAAPAIQVAVSALAHQREMIPPTVNWEYPDPACPLNLSNRARSIQTDAALVNAHGVGGVNTSLVLQRC